MSQAGELPITPQERTASVDVLRGFALLGVVLANLISFFTFPMPEEVITRATRGWINHTYEWLFIVLIDNKFITLFSLLFGYGFGVLIERMKERGMNPTRFYVRRMTILFAMGILHVFVWWGEILHTYAICGLLMLLFTASSDRNLLRWFFFFMLGPPLVVRYFMISTKAFDPAVSEGVYADYLETALRTDLLSVFHANWRIHQYVYVQCLAEWTDLFQALSKFLFGYWIFRRGILTDFERHRTALRKVVVVCCVIAAVYVGLGTWFFYTHPTVRSLPLRFLIYDFNRIGVLALTITYAYVLIAWHHKYSSSTVLNAFRHVGMMSLSNYLTHTVFYIVLLHGIGFGLMGKLTAIETLALGLTIYTLQVFISQWWLKRYRLGPAEWIWRQMSYGVRIPVARTPGP